MQTSKSKTFVAPQDLHGNLRSKEPHFLCDTCLQSLTRTCSEAAIYTQPLDTGRGCCLICVDKLPVSSTFWVSQNEVNLENLDWWLEFTFLSSHAASSLLTCSHRTFRSQNWTEEAEGRTDQVSSARVL